MMTYANLHPAGMLPRPHALHRLGTHLLAAQHTGRSATPPLFAVAAIQGKEACLRRLARAGDLVARAQAAAPAR